MSHLPRRKSLTAQAAHGPDSIQFHSKAAPRSSLFASASKSEGAGVEVLKDSREDGEAGNLPGLVIVEIGPGRGWGCFIGQVLGGGVAAEFAFQQSAQSLGTRTNRKD